MFFHVLIQNKHSGFRRSDPTTPATPVIEPPQSDRKCNNCDFKATNETILKKHIDKKHCKCDICSNVIPSPESLRKHVKGTHRIINGTMKECKWCKFSTLNESHIKLHLKGIMKLHVKL